MSVLLPMERGKGEGGRGRNQRRGSEGVGEVGRERREREREGEGQRARARESDNRREGELTQGYVRLRTGPIFAGVYILTREGGRGGESGFAII